MTAIPTPAPAARDQAGFHPVIPLLIRDLLHAPLASAADQVIVSGQRRHTYRDLHQRICQLANTLRAQGVQAGDVVAVMDWDSHRYLEAYFAVPMIGATLMTVNVRLSPDQVRYTLAHAGASTVLVHADFVPLLASLAEALPGLRRRVLLADAADAKTPEGFAGEYEALLAQQPTQAEFPDLDENTTATLFYTTGTTGLPKGVSFSQRQLVLHTLSVMAMLGASPDQGRLSRADVYMPMTPMFHVHAWGLPFVATALGVKQVYPGRYAPDVLLELIRREHVTFSHGVPTVLQMLLSAPGASEGALRGVKMVVGGSALPDGLARAALAAGMDVFTGYGMSETCPILSISQLDAAAVAATGDEVTVRRRAGRPAPLVQLEVQDNAGRFLPHDGTSTGEVVARAPWLTRGYLGNAQASADLWQGGVLHTGDIGAIDAHGYLQVTDRLKDVIKTGGEWISSLDLESLVSRHPSVAEVAVVGMPDARWGERPLVLVVPRGDVAEAELAEGIRALVTEAAAAGQVSRFAIPEHVRCVPALERTSVGKLNKRALRAQHVG